MGRVRGDRAVRAGLRKLRKADILVLSVAKSGRTWFRVLLNKYFSLKHDIPFTVDDMSASSKHVPGIAYTHELWLHNIDSTFWERLTGKHLIPDSLIFKHKLLVLYRDPRDVIVSFFFQVTKRVVTNFTFSV